MATSKETMDYFLTQTAGAGNMRAKRMFGEYTLYCENKVVGLVCDDQLFIKITPVADNYLDKSHDSPPFEGAKPWKLVPEDKWEDKLWLADFIRETATFVEVTKPKIKKQKHEK